VPKLPSKEQMRRVVVIGASCSGRTLLAEAISKCLGLPHVEIDSFVWQPIWSLPSEQQLLEMVKSKTSAEAWVIDGVFPEHRDMVWARADRLVWLNYPMTLVFTRALRRTLKRLVTRERLGEHNVETWRRTFFLRSLNCSGSSTVGASAGEIIQEFFAGRKYATYGSFNSRIRGRPSFGLAWMAFTTSLARASLRASTNVRRN